MDFAEVERRAQYRHHRFHRCSRDRPAHGLGRRKSAIASRWPDGSEVSSSNDLQPAADDPAASRQTDATPESQPAVSPIALTAAHAPSAKPSNSTQMLLIVMASALAFSGLVAAMIFNRKPAAPADVGDDHPPAPWDSSHVDRPSRPRFMDEEVPIRRAGGAQARVRQGTPRSRSRNCWRALPAARPRDEVNYFSSWRCRLRTNSVRPVRRSRLSRSALRIDCTSAKASSTFWLTTM